MSDELDPIIEVYDQWQRPLHVALERVTKIGHITITYDNNALCSVESSRGESFTYRIPAPESGSREQVWEYFNRKHAELLEVWRTVLRAKKK